MVPDLVGQGKALRGDVPCALVNKRFLQTIDRAVPEHLAVHLVLATAANPSFVLHMSSPSLNVVERDIRAWNEPLERRPAF